MLCEIIGTFTLVLGVLAILSPEVMNAEEKIIQKEWALGLKPLLVGLLVFSIGLSLGGPTGYAINPARDLGPRIAHTLLPIAGKGGSDWSYAWIPVVGPCIGGVLGALGRVVDDRGEKVNKKIAEAEVAKIPYMAVIGGREAENNNVALRTYAEGRRGVISVQEFIDEMVEKISTRALDAKVLENRLARRQAELGDEDAGEDMEDRGC